MRAMKEKWQALDQGGKEQPEEDMEQNLSCIGWDVVLRILAYLPTSLVRSMYRGPWAKYIVEGPGFRRLQIG